MAVRASYIITCDKCGTDSGASRPTEQDATAYAVAGGWSAYPTLCPDCNARAKEATVTNKIAGLYLNLAKALNALEEAGEDVRQGEYMQTPELVGETGTVRWDPETERYGVVQA